MQIYKIPTTMRSNRVRNVGIHGYCHRSSRVPVEIPRFDEAPAPHLPLPARDEQGLRDERVEDACASGTIVIVGSVVTCQSRHCIANYNVGRPLNNSSCIDL